MTVPAGLSGDLILLSAIGVGSLLVVMVGFTLGPSVYLARRDELAERRRDPLREELLARLYEPGPSWSTWVGGLDDRDRTVLRSLVRTQLRWVRGTERERLRRLAECLGLDEDAERLFAADERHRRLQGLTWLTLLGRSVDPTTLVERCRDHPDTRAAGARLLCDTDHPDARETGGGLLLAPGEPLSVLGVDTLYQLYKHDPAGLADRAATAGDGWAESLRIQVLGVFGECAAVGSDVSLAWVLSGLADESPRVRRAAIDALDDYGWRSPVHAAVVCDAVAADPSPLVRRAAYRRYGDWATEESLARLDAALRIETDDRSRVVAARALRRAGRLPMSTTAGRVGESTPDPVVEWVAAETEVGR